MSEAQHQQVAKLNQTPLSQAAKKLLSGRWDNEKLYLAQLAVQMFDCVGGITGEISEELDCLLAQVIRRADDPTLYYQLMEGAYTQEELLEQLTLDTDSPNPREEDENVENQIIELAEILEQNLLSNLEEMEDPDEPD